MPRQNNSTFLLTTKKPFAKISEAFLFPSHIPESILPFAKINIVATPPQQFHQESPQLQIVQASNTKSNEWSEEDDLKLYDLHNELGNKWIQISRNFAGKSDNYVKNHFFSRLRMSLRHLNRSLTPQSTVKPAKMHVIYKIISTCEDRFNPDSQYTANFINFAYQLKNKILHFFIQKQTCWKSNGEQTLEKIHLFNRQYKMRSDILRVPKYLKNKKIQKIEDSRDSQSSHLNFRDIQFYECEQQSNIKNNGQVLQPNVFQNHEHNQNDEIPTIQSILHQGSRLSQLLFSEAPSIDIKMVDTSDYLFNDEYAQNDWLNKELLPPWIDNLQDLLY